MQELEKLTEERQQLTFKEKCHLMAETLRNCKGLSQTIGELHLDNKFCAFGALGFRAGIPKSELGMFAYDKILGAYGISEDEASRLYKIPYGEDYEKFKTFRDMIWNLNDHHWNFNEVAVWLDSLE